MNQVTKDELADVLVRSYNDGAGRTVCIEGKTALAIVAVLRGQPAVCECHGVPVCPVDEELRRGT